MSHLDKLLEIEKRRKVLQNAREEILGKLISEREQRSQWLIKLIDIDDELEELSRQSKALT
ncbi:hypothetical protein [Desulfosporosinus meridiei]|uniref:Uncharacterized protein n=1 Tax=Desulfosporosinus meridiei (strain ATCC BAA-275 / DSM 13257 / KCTC 12902 / NCIMB 13706 / S10) TaxID=768704 RepID=J7IR23_DESMD|nr:hypothetical protein [Desulfosporosinus meridiei]AFQ42634.1 hypothetical protein Desmer_0600 [Desulfosporosinus meridiei DSM 13257]